MCAMQEPPACVHSAAQLSWQVRRQMLLKRCHHYQMRRNILRGFRKTAHLFVSTQVRPLTEPNLPALLMIL